MYLCILGFLPKLLSPWQDFALKHLLSQYSFETTVHWHQGEHLCSFVFCFLQQWYEGGCDVQGLCQLYQSIITVSLRKHHVGYPISAHASSLCTTDRFLSAKIEVRMNALPLRNLILLTLLRISASQSSKSDKIYCYHRKAQRAKEIARNKKERKFQRDAQSLQANPDAIKDELKEVLALEEEGKGNQTVRLKKKALQGAYDHAVKKRKVIVLSSPADTYIWDSVYLYPLVVIHASAEMIKLMH